MKFIAFLFECGAECFFSALACVLAIVSDTDQYLGILFLVDAVNSDVYVGK